MKPAAKNYLGFTSQEELMEAVALTAQFLEIPVSAVAEHQVLEARAILSERRLLEAAARLINDDADETEF
jgi:hypothetical protein